LSKNRGFLFQIISLISKNNGLIIFLNNLIFGGKIMKKVQMVSLVFYVVSLALIFSCASSGSTSEGGWEWNVGTDAGNGGSSTITMSDETLEGVPGYAFKGTITKKYEYGFVNVQLRPDDAMLGQLKQAKAISFRILGNGDKFAVKITTSDVKDYAYFEYQFETVDGQPQTVVVPIEYFMQPSWGQAVAASVNLANADFIEYQYQGPAGPYEFKLWDFRVHTKGVPKEKDLLPKGAAKSTAAAAAAEKPIGGDLSPMEISLVDNFEYGEGYQAVIGDKRLFNGHKIVPGEKYTLKITYTASRDLEDVVNVGLVDTTPAAKYWTALSWKDGDDPGMAELPQSKKGEKVTATISLTTTATATSTSGLANALVFITKGAGRKGAKGSGVQKAVTLNCTEFVFTKD
jgi:hypothetical protein